MANSEIIGAGQDTARRAPKKILDACCGGRMFWFDKQTNGVVFMDRRNEIHQADKRPGRSAIVIAPDVLADFCEMPFKSFSFDHVVFDPPHRTTLTSESDGKTWLARKYGRLLGNWQAMVQEGFCECFRVLRIGGTLVFKWCEYDVPLCDVLALTPEKPLYGHRSGKQSKTHWVTFIKGEESPVLGEESPAQNTKEICHTAPNSASPKAAQEVLELDL